MQTCLTTSTYLALALGALWIGSCGAALGDETFTLKRSDPATCRALGEGFRPSPDNRGCVRIDRYIAVGSQLRFVGAGVPSSGVFAAHPVSAAPVAKSAEFDSSPSQTLGGDRLYVQFGSDAPRE